MTDAADASAAGSSGGTSTQCPEAVEVTLLSMSGAPTRLRPLPPDATVRDLALQVRTELSMPVSVQNLIHGSVCLADPSMRLSDAFGAVRSVQLTVVRRPFTPEERAQLHQRLVRAAAAGHVAQLRELLKEGAQVDFKPEGSGVDTSVSLTHWPEAEEEEEAKAAGAGRPQAQRGGERGQGGALRLRVESLEEMELFHLTLEERCLQLGATAEDAPIAQATITDASGVARSSLEFTSAYREGPPEGSFPLVFEWSLEQISKNAKQRAAMDSDSSQDSEDEAGGRGAEASGERPAAGKGPCGGLTPLLVAVAVGDEELARDLRQLGAAEPDMATTHGSLPEAFQHLDFPDVVKHLAAGADVDARLRNGQGISATEEGAPLHACAALHRRPGAYELAQVLIRKKADLSAKDKEGDNPLAHARYFNAVELYQLLKGSGSRLEGPFYERFGRA